MSLASRLESALASRLRFHEWRRAGLLTLPAEEAMASSGAKLEERGAYLLARAPSAPGLWAGLRASLASKRPLVLLPPSSSLEEAILLRQLPGSPPAEAALVLFTSGSTGEPKAVLHGEASLLASAAQLGRAFPGSAPTASLLPPWGMAGVAFHCLLPIERRSDLLFSSAPLLEWGAHAGAIFAQLAVELVTLNPFLLDMLLRSGLDPAWRGTLVSLTAPLKRSQRTALQAVSGREPREIYGMTEAAGPVLLDGLSLGAQTRLSVSLELELRGPQLMLGYASLGAFEPAPAWFPTGDLFLDDRGALRHQARLRELIDTGGRKIAPRLLEEAVEEMPELAECLAFPVRLGGLERPGLVYLRKRGCLLPRPELAAAVERFFASKLSAELRPKWWQEVEELPRLANGKADRLAVRSRWGCPGPKASTSTS